VTRSNSLQVKHAERRELAAAQLIFGLLLAQAPSEAAVGQSKFVADVVHIVRGVRLYRDDVGG
jgi:hypothetical protein